MPKPLDLSGLSRFRASELLGGNAAVPSSGVPLQVDLNLLDADPNQPRRRFQEESIDALSASIRIHGVLEPVSVRSSSSAPGRYVVNRGERRVRAARRAGLSTVPAFVDERIDPFAQAVENLHREDMSPFDLSDFIREREGEGTSRADIARRLAKSKSFVTEAAALSEASTEIRQAVAQGRLGTDVRMLYRLVTAWRQAPEAVSQLIDGKEAINRSAVDAMLLQLRRGDASRRGAPVEETTTAATAVSGGTTVLVIEHAGRRATLRFKAHDSDVGEVRFADGSSSVLPLRDLRLVCWAVAEKR